MSDLAPGGQVGGAQLPMRAGRASFTTRTPRPCAPVPPALVPTSLARVAPARPAPARPPLAAPPSRDHDLPVDLRPGARAVRAGPRDGAARAGRRRGARRL